MYVLPECVEASFLIDLELEVKKMDCIPEKASWRSSLFFPNTAPQQETVYCNGIGIVVKCRGEAFKPREKMEMKISESSAKEFLQKEIQLLTLKRQLGKEDEIEKLKQSTPTLDDHIDSGT